MLWSFLLTHADDFERRMDVEHVEDVLINKRVVGRDERYDLEEYFMDGPNQMWDPRAIYDADIEREVCNLGSTKISQVNRRQKEFISSLRRLGRSGAHGT